MEPHPTSIYLLLNKWGAAVSGTSYPEPPQYDGPDAIISNFVEHSDYVKSGSCFTARVRTGTDGHAYIGQAARGGAALIIGEKPSSEMAAELGAVPYLQAADSSLAEAWLSAAFYDFPGSQMINIGVTGTDGKTTTVNLLHEILVAAGLQVGMISTLKVSFGDSEEPLAFHVTTPEAPVIQSHLRRMVDQGLTHCILEVTSHALSQNRVAAIDFVLAAVTNVTHEHLDYHGDYESYLAAKAKLFRSLSLGEIAGSRKNGPEIKLVKAAILNADDQSFAKLSEAALEKTVVYGLGQNADLSALDIHYQPEGINFTLRFSGKSGASSIQMPDIPIETTLLGPFNVYNILAAAAAASELNITPESIKQGIKNLQGLTGRMERIEAGQPFEVIVDFAHTPNALERAIAAARSMSSGRVITVFGSAGKRDVAKRRLLAEASAQLADLTILTAEDPRTDSLDEILEIMAEGCRAHGSIEGETFWRIPDRGRAIYWALSIAQTGDLVLICGKGHEQSMCFGSVEYPWDDINVTSQMVAALLNSQPPPDTGLPTFLPVNS